MQDIGQEINFSDEIEIVEQVGFQLFPNGNYIAEIYKNPDVRRFNGSEKMAACSIVSYSLKVTDSNGKFTFVNHDLFMNTKSIGSISSFLIGFGVAKKGERLNPNWNNMVGLQARVKVVVETFKSKATGEDINKNKITFFYDTSEQVEISSSILNNEEKKPFNAF